MVRGLNSNNVYTLAKNRKKKKKEKKEKIYLPLGNFVFQVIFAVFV